MRFGPWCLAVSYHLFVAPDHKFILNHFKKVTSPLIKYYDEKGVLKTFKGTQSDVIYPKVKEWLEQHA